MNVTREMVETANLKMTGPSIRLAPNYAGWLRKFADKHNDPKASVLRNAAWVIDQQRLEIERLGRELERVTDGVPGLDGGQKNG